MKIIKFLWTLIVQCLLKPVVMRVFLIYIVATGLPVLYLFSEQTHIFMNFDVHTQFSSWLSFALYIAIIVVLRYFYWSDSNIFFISPTRVLTIIFFLLPLFPRCIVFYIGSTFQPAQCYAFIPSTLFLFLST